jgi:hypothetical protein
MKNNNTYWILFSGNIGKVLTERYGKAYTKTAMPKIKQQYRVLLSRFPDVGNSTLTNMVYLGIIFLAIWVGTDKRLSMPELTEICGEILKRLKWFFGIIDLNKSWAKKKLERETNDYMKWLAEKGTAYPNKWEGYADDKIHDKGIYYVFTKCPIRDFCEENGYMEALSALCAQDYLMYGMMHGVLKRGQTLANGTCCDFWIYGNKE